MKITLAEHRQLVKTLLEEPHFGHACGPVELVETHISSVLLTGDYAYKIKKPLDLGFLDFSTLALRKHYCEEELRLNGRMAPGIYLGVVSITGSINRPRIDGDGPVIEYAVRMRQFDQSGLLGRLLHRGELSGAIIDELADVVAAFHATAAVAPGNSDFGNAAAVYAPVSRNFEIIRPLLDSPNEQQRLDRLQAWADHEFNRLQPTLAKRKKDGFIRECHGDLHLGNIALIKERVTDSMRVPKGVVTLFDGIEFNEQLHWIDIMSDLAFISMDLIDHSATALAWRLINRYLEHSGDYEGLEVLCFYQAYRAMVRAKIACIRLDQDDLGAEERRSTMRQYQGYADLAERFTGPRTPLLILTCGVSGSGKSWLSRQLLEALPACRIRSDVERKRLLPSLRSDNQEINTGLYSAQATAKTYQRLLTLAGGILANGYSTIVDAAFLKVNQRQPFHALAEHIACPLIILHTCAGRDILEERILKRRSESGNVSDATLDVLKAQLAGFETPTTGEGMIEIDTSQPVAVDALVKAVRSIEAQAPDYRPVMPCCDIVCAEKSPADCQSAGIPAKNP